MTPTLIVIPCFDEERRLDRAQLERLLADERVGLVLVDDGSRDGTLALLHAFAEAHSGRVDVVAKRPNGGKGEAVRAGMLRAIALGAELIGYLDADFATPAVEMLRVLDALRAGGVSAALGARVRLLGRHIERKPVRHYLGRVFATLGSLALQLDVYDTQCGAKAFRVSPTLARALERPFRSRWAFDLELLERLLADAQSPLSAEDFVEVPLGRWRDAGGSKLRLGGMARALWDVGAIALARRGAGRRR